MVKDILSDFSELSEKDQENLVNAHKELENALILDVVEEALSAESGADNKRNFHTLYKFPQRFRSLRRQY